ncbi:MAG: hypothetical protein IIC78_09300 [Chloroflexi bacterium]|nr:hypothetical protein [Chloroflexota bacterium]
MNVGMLWYDAKSNDDLSTRINHASEYYQEKYGRKPNLCFMNPVTAGLDPAADVTRDEGLNLDSAEGIRVELSAIVLPDHFWIGVEKKEAR